MKCMCMYYSVFVCNVGLYLSVSDVRICMYSNAVLLDVVVSVFVYEVVYLPLPILCTCRLGKYMDLYASYICTRIVCVFGCKCADVLHTSVLTPVMLMWSVYILT